MINKFRIIELFGGIGACTQALKRLGIDVEVVDYVEIDKYAVRSYNAINDTNFEPQDILEWHKHFDDIDLIMHGSPCQDFSNAGLGKGGDEGSGTRSSLMYETLRIVEDIKPKYVLWENVKNLISKTHKHNFDEYIRRMEALGYESYWKVLNSKDYGVPQNRERVFTLSIRNDANPFNIMYPFEFPKPIPLDKCLNDVLEDQVDEKYYLKPEIVEKFVANNDIQKSLGNNFKFKPVERERESKQSCNNQERQALLRVDKRAGYIDKGTGRHQSNEVFRTDTESRTIQANEWKDPLKIIE